MDLPNQTIFITPTDQQWESCQQRQKLICQNKPYIYLRLKSNQMPYSTPNFRFQMHQAWQTVCPCQQKDVSRLTKYMSFSKRKDLLDPTQYLSLLLERNLEPISKSCLANRKECKPISIYFLTNYKVVLNLSKYSNTFPIATCHTFPNIFPFQWKGHA